MREKERETERGESYNAFYNLVTQCLLQHILLIRSKSALSNLYSGEKEGEIPPFCRQTFVDIFKTTVPSNLILCK